MIVDNDNLAMRRDYFLIGLGIRLLMLTFFLYGTEFESYNDMSQIIFDAIEYFLNGVNPYSAEAVYTLHWGSNIFTQPFNYGPVTLLLYLPAMLIPIRYRTLWVGMYVMINLYCFLTSQYLMKKACYDQGIQKNANIQKSGHDPRVNRYLYYAGMMIWILPIGTTVVTVFIYAPLYLTVLAFGERDRPFLSALLISLAALSYQLIFLFIPIYLVYTIKRAYPHLKSYFIGGPEKPAINFIPYLLRKSVPVLKFFAGLIPGILFFLIFEFWSEGGAIYSVFRYTSEMGYVKCPVCDHSIDRWSIFSIPQVAYQFSNGRLQIGNLSRLILVSLLTVYLVFFLFSEKMDRNPALYFQFYIVLAAVGFTLTNNYGQLHYLIFIEIPLLYITQMRKPDFRKNKTIGPGIYSWARFNRYIRKNHQLPQ